MTTVSNRFGVWLIIFCSKERKRKGRSFSSIFWFCFIKQASKYGICIPPKKVIEVNGWPKKKENRKETKRESISVACEDDITNNFPMCHWISWHMTDVFFLVDYWLVIFLVLEALISRLEYDSSFNRLSELGLFVLRTWSRIKAPLICLDINNTWTSEAFLHLQSALSHIYYLIIYM